MNCSNSTDFSSQPGERERESRSGSRWAELVGMVTSFQAERWRWSWGLDKTWLYLFVRSRSLPNRTEQMRSVLESHPAIIVKSSRGLATMFSPTLCRFSRPLLPLLHNRLLTVLPVTVTQRKYGYHETRSLLLSNPSPSRCLPMSPGRCLGMAYLPFTEASRDRQQGLAWLSSRFTTITQTLPLSTFTTPLLAATLDFHPIISTTFMITSCYFFRQPCLNVARYHSAVEQCRRLAVGDRNVAVDFDVNVSSLAR